MKVESQLLGCSNLGSYEATLLRRKKVLGSRDAVSYSLPKGVAAKRMAGRVAPPDAKSEYENEENNYNKSICFVGFRISWIKY